MAKLSVVHVTGPMGQKAAIFFTDCGVVGFENHEIFGISLFKSLLFLQSQSSARNSAVMVTCN